jgi:hypothetical protein
MYLSFIHVTSISEGPVEILPIFFNKDLSKITNLLPSVEDIILPFLLKALLSNCL